MSYRTTHTDEWRKNIHKIQNEATISYVHILLVFAH
jgi:hypothetical protein